MLLLDGASLDYVWPRAAGGRLPNFARLLETGASMDLATVRPTGPDPVWAAVATGMYPAKNGVRSPAEYYVRGDTRPFALLPDYCFSHVLVQLGLLRREPNSSASLRARPLWSILGRRGHHRRHRALAADVSGAAGARLRAERSLPPAPRIGPRARRERRVSVEVAARRPRRVCRARTKVPTGCRRRSPATTRRRRPKRPPDCATCSTAARCANLRAEWPVQLSAVRYQGLDTVGHYNLRVHGAARRGRAERGGAPAARCR